MTKANYLSKEECTDGFHVYKANAKLDSKCLCKRRRLSIKQRGFIKVKRTYECA